MVTRFAVRERISAPKIEGRPKVAGIQALDSDGVMLAESLVGNQDFMDDKIRGMCAAVLVCPV